jgi:hypothetical protein
MPAIFSNTGLQTPPAIAAAYEDPLEAPLSPRAGLSAIEEDTVKDQEEVAEEEKGWRALPKLIILQVCSYIGNSLALISRSTPCWLFTIRVSQLKYF